MIYATPASRTRIDFVKNELAKRGILSSVVESWAKGGDGAIDIATQLVELVEKEEPKKYYMN